jgi:hypothetical protein
VAFLRLEIIKKRPGLDPKLSSSHKIKLEPNPFLLKLSICTLRRALTDVVDGLETFLGGATSIAFHQKYVWHDRHGIRCVEELFGA